MKESIWKIILFIPLLFLIIFDVACLLGIDSILGTILVVAFVLVYVKDVCETQTREVKRRNMEWINQHKY